MVVSVPQCISVVLQTFASEAFGIRRRTRTRSVWHMEGDAGNYRILQLTLQLYIEHMHISKCVCSVWCVVCGV